MGIFTPKKITQEELERKAQQFRDSAKQFNDQFDPVVDSWFDKIRDSQYTLPVLAGLVLVVGAVGYLIGR